MKQASGSRRGSQFRGHRTTVQATHRLGGALLEALRERGVRVQNHDRARTALRLELLRCWSARHRQRSVSERGRHKTERKRKAQETTQAGSAQRKRHTQVIQQTKHPRTTKWAAAGSSRLKRDKTNLVEVEVDNRDVRPARGRRSDAQPRHLHTEHRAHHKARARERDTSHT